VVTSGTGKAASYGGFAAGKTGTTEDYGDAWFVGFNERYSVAVWVGYADRLRAMKTEYRGGPVAGGTFPAEIWRDFMLQAKAIDERRAAAQAAKRTGDGATTTTGSVPVPAPTTTPTTTTPAPDTKPTDTTAKPDAKTPAPKKQPAPKPDAAPGAPAQQPTPTPTPAPGPAPPSTGGGASPPTG